MRRRLVSAARCAIKMRSKEVDRKNAVRLLKRDLLNGPNHCFGHHIHCSADFCSTVKNQPQPSTTSVSDDAADHDDDDDDNNNLAGKSPTEK